MSIPNLDNEILDLDLMLPIIDKIWGSGEGLGKIGAFCL